MMAAWVILMWRSWGDLGVGDGMVDDARSATLWVGGINWGGML